MTARPGRSWCSPFLPEPQRLHYELTDLHGPGEAVIAARHVSLRVADTVPVTNPDMPHAPPRLLFDPLLPFPQDGFVLSPGANSLLWLTVFAPAATPAGRYEGSLVLSADNGDAVTIALKVLVYDVNLALRVVERPEVGFWQSFGHIAAAYDLPLWSEQWWVLVEAFLTDMADLGQTVVQVGRGYFDWRRGPDGRWSFDFTRFDRYVELCTRLGITGPIEYVQMFDARGDTLVHYTDSTGRRWEQIANPGDALFDDAWSAFAAALARHCREKDWLERLYICTDDEASDSYGPPTLERFRHCVILLRRADAAHRTVAAVECPKAFSALVDDIDRPIIRLGSPIHETQALRTLRDRGGRVEAHIGARPPRPNTFITSGSVEPRVLGWIVWREQLAGLHRWSYVNWPPDVFTDPAGGSAAPPGDRFLVYPGDDGPLASVRRERLRDGLGDYRLLQMTDYYMQRARTAQQRETLRTALEQAIALVRGEDDGAPTAFDPSPEALLTARRLLLEALQAAAPAP